MATDSDATGCSARLSKWWNKVAVKAGEPVDIAGLVFFRGVLGVVLIWEVWRYFAHDWIRSVYIAPRFHFTYPGFEWLQPWPGVGMYWHFAAMGFLAALFLVGLRYRVAAFLLGLALAFVFLLEKSQYLNHFYLVILLCFWMALVPAHRAWSLDSRSGRVTRSDSVPAWCYWLLRAQVGLPYFFGGVAKLNGDWLHGHPMQMWMSRMEAVRSVVPAFGEHWLALLFSYGGLLLDLLVVPALLWRRTRALAFCAVIGFHLFNAVMFRIGIFPWLMIGATTLFLSPDWPRRWLRRPSRSARKSSNQQSPFSRHPLIANTVLAVLLVECLLPFRHWLYSGNVDWTEEGSRFSWRMMLCDKTGVMRIELRDPKTGQTGGLDPRQFLNRQQLDRMGRDPEMLREFAAFIKRDLAKRGLPSLEIRVFTLCSLNGRKPQLLVDPAIDLGAQPRTLRHNPWIVPLVEPLRAEPWLVPLNEWEQALQLSAGRNSRESGYEFNASVDRFVSTLDLVARGTGDRGQWRPTTQVMPPVNNNTHRYRKLDDG